MPGVVGPEDVRLAAALGVPLLGPEPDAAALYTSKSGAKQVFEDANVSSPVGAWDIYEEEELYANMAKLIADNLHVTRCVCVWSSPSSSYYYYSCHSSLSTIDD